MTEPHLQMEENQVQRLKVRQSMRVDTLIVETRHTCDTCFKLHGYPEWWNELKAKKQKDAASGLGRVALASAGLQLSLISQIE